VAESAYGKPGTLLRIDGTDGAVVHRTPVGSVPASIAVSPAGVWVANQADTSAVDAHKVIELSTSGERRHTYPVMNPSSLVADATGAWAGSVSGDAASVLRLSAGKIVIRVQLPGHAFGGSVPLVRCDTTLYAATVAEPGTDTLVSAISTTGTVSTYGSVARTGMVHLICAPGGVILQISDSGIGLYRLPAGAHAALPPFSGTAVADTSQAWLTAGTIAGNSDVRTVSPGDLTFGPALTVPGDVVSAATTGNGHLWALLANVPGSPQMLLEDFGAGS
jgi:hypothetical protein